MTIDTPMKELSTISSGSLETQSIKEVHPYNFHSKLMEIESSTDSEYVLSVFVSEVCAEFSTPSGVELLRAGSYTKLPAIISMILSQQSS